MQKNGVFILQKICKVSKKLFEIIICPSSSLFFVWYATSEILKYFTYLIESIIDLGRLEKVTKVKKVIFLKILEIVWNMWRIDFTNKFHQ